MYFIVSASKNYKPNPQFYVSDAVIYVNTIGHEIHVTRPILFILLSMGLIDSSAIIVTRSNERFFFYSKIFKNIIQYDDLPSNIDPDQLIDLTEANMWFDGKQHSMIESGFEKAFPIMTQIREKGDIPFRTPYFNSLIRSMDYPDCSDIIKKTYVVVHHRIVDYNTSQTIYDTQKIIKAIRDIDKDVQIFVFSRIPLSDLPEDILVVTTISMYASLMNNPMCKAVFTEFSGGGQLSQYCHHRNIFVFQNNYLFVYINRYNTHNLNEIITYVNSPTNLYEGFDIKLFTGANIYQFSNLESLLTNMHTYYPNTRYLCL